MKRTNFDYLLVILSIKIKSMMMNLLFCLFIFWPAFYWLIYFLKNKHIPKMSQEDLINFPNLSFLEYSISHLWDIVFWIILVVLSLLIDFLIDRIKFVYKKFFYKLLYLAFCFLAIVFIFLGSIYAIALFIIFMIKYFILVLFLYLIGLNKKK